MKNELFLHNFIIFHKGGGTNEFGKNGGSICICIYVCNMLVWLCIHLLGYTLKLTKVIIIIIMGAES